jgi:hypothetical protein
MQAQAMQAQAHQAQQMAYSNQFAPKIENAFYPAQGMPF